jgi:cytochrome c biogenesis protein CcmG, thiol:disulfide interchange protein DsbE
MPDFAAVTRGRVIGLVVVALIAGGVVAAELLTAGGGSAGRPAPELPSQVLSGHRVDLASLRGRPAFINFWASWCEPCKEEAPELKRFDAGLGNRATLVGVDWGDSEDNARAFIAKSGWDYPILRDPSQKVGTRYGLNGLPTTFVLDSEGNIVQTLQGPQTLATLNRALAAAQ